jgi:hypothetical protein
MKLYWYDGGMRPLTPDELLEDGKSIPATGTLLIGDKGTILNNELIPAKKMREYRSAKGLLEPQGGRGRRGARGGETEWLAACQGGPASQGNFLNAANCSEAIALAGANDPLKPKDLQRKPLRSGIVVGPREHDVHQHRRIQPVPDARIS